MILNALVLTCCFVSLLNLVFTILLSNSLFRIVSRLPEGAPVSTDDDSDRGLVDLKPTPTYDIRFRPEKR